MELIIFFKIFILALFKRSNGQSMMNNPSFHRVNFKMDANGQADFGGYGRELDQFFSNVDYNDTTQDTAIAGQTLPSTQGKGSMRGRTPRKPTNRPETTMSQQIFRGQDVTGRDSVNNPQLLSMNDPGTFIDGSNGQPYYENSLTPQNYFGQEGDRSTSGPSSGVGTNDIRSGPVGQWRTWSFRTGTTFGNWPPSEISPTRTGRVADVPTLVPRDNVGLNQGLVESNSFFARNNPFFGESSPSFGESSPSFDESSPSFPAIGASPDNHQWRNGLSASEVSQKVRVDGVNNGIFTGNAPVQDSHSKEINVNRPRSDVIDNTPGTTNRDRASPLSSRKLFPLADFKKDGRSVTTDPLAIMPHSEYSNGTRTGNEHAKRNNQSRDWTNKEFIDVESLRGNVSQDQLGNDLLNDVQAFETNRLKDHIASTADSNLSPPGLTSGFALPIGPLSASRELLPRPVLPRISDMFNPAEFVFNQAGFMPFQNAQESNRLGVQREQPFNFRSLPPFMPTFPSISRDFPGNSVMTVWSSWSETSDSRSSNIIGRSTTGRQFV